MVERVGRVLIDMGFSPMSDAHLDKASRAAIEAMREPDEAIIRAMRGRALASDCSTDQGARDIYSSMHYAALNRDRRESL